METTSNSRPNLSETNALTRAEKDRLAENERVIQSTLLSFVEMGKALEDIKEKRLYRARYKTFEDYCRNRWGFSRQRAFQLIGSAEKADLLSTAVDIPPTIEAQVRPLVGLSDDQAVEAWRSAEKNAKNGEVTGPLVRKAADEVRGIGLKGAADDSDRDLSTLDRLCGKLSAREEWDDNAKARLKMSLKKLLKTAREIGILDDA